jgi:D-inositol-3-phosphate glycosyltransferase
VVRDGVTGLLVDGHEPEDYATAIGRLVRDGSLREEMARAALAHAREFAWERTADQTLDVYRKAAVALWNDHPSTRQEAVGG